MVLDPRYQEDYPSDISKPFKFWTIHHSDHIRPFKIQTSSNSDTHCIYNGLKLPKAIRNPNGADFESHLNTERTPFHSNTTHSGPVF